MANTARAEQWELTRSAAKEGRFDDINAEHYVRHYPSIRRIAQDNPQKPATINVDLDRVNLWLFGPPGTGKSRFARHLCGNQQYDKNCNKWWDGYQGEHDVLIDDFDKSHHVLAHHLKQWADRYRFTGEHKGSSACMRPQRLIVTSNYDISEIGWDEVTVAAIERRFRKVLFDKAMDPSTFDGLAEELQAEVRVARTASESTLTTEPLESAQALETEANGNENNTPSNDSDLSEEDYIARKLRIHHMKTKTIIDDSQFVGPGDEEDDDEYYEYMLQNHPTEEEFYNM